MIILSAAGVTPQTRITAIESAPLAVGGPAKMTGRKLSGGRMVRRSLYLQPALSVLEHSGGNPWPIA